MQVIQVPREIIGIADHGIEISALPEPPVLHARQPRSQRALEASDQHRDIGPGSGRQHQMQVIVQQHMAVMPERMKASRVIKRFQCNGTRADLAQPRLACVASEGQDRTSTRMNSSHYSASCMPTSASTGTYTYSHTLPLRGRLPIRPPCPEAAIAMRA